MQPPNFVKIGFSIIAFGGSILWACTEGGFESCLASIASLGAFIFVVYELVAANSSSSAFEVSTASNESSIGSKLSQLRADFLSTTNLVELYKIRLQLLELKDSNAEAMMLYEMVEKAIKYHKDQIINSLILTILTISVLNQIIGFMRQLLGF